MKSVLLRTTAVLLAMAGARALAVENPASPREDRAARMAWWREARFGMFIHYGPVSLTGKEISWSRANTNPRCPNKGPTPADVYDNLYKKFNPTQFHAADWTGLAKRSGMKYVVLTAKHCDGFLLWDSKVDGYNITATPFKRDLCAELAQAVRDDGLHLGWYFSPMDWRDPDCRSNNNARFVAHIQDELRELLTRYGRVDVLWFDTDAQSADWNQATTYPLVRGLQPQILINNRLEIGSEKQWQDQGFHSDNEDFYTPEQTIGAYDDQRPWETCMTLGQQWSWKPDDQIKSPAEVVAILCRTAGGDGNLLLNVGPMPDGRIEPRQVEVLEKVGAWLHVNGRSIYGTRGGPWKPTAQITSTRKGKMAYVHVLQAAGGTLELLALPRQVLAASVLGGGPVKIESAHGSFVLHLPEKHDPLATVIELEFDGPVMDLPAMAVPAAKPAATQTQTTAPAVHHSFLAADPRAGRVALVDQTGTISWSCAAQDTCDMALLADGRVLLSDKGGARIVRRDGTTAWDYRAPQGAEVYSCQMLADGKVLVCEGGSKRLVEVGSDGKIAKQIPLASDQDVHGQFRIARKLANGTYLVAFWRDGCVKEIAADGQVKRSISGLGEAYMAQRLANGNTLIGCGDAHRVVEVDAAGKAVWEVGENDLPGHPLRFVGQVERLANGNTLICNWPCHGHEGEQPLLVEISRDKQVVWQFDGRDRFRGILGIQLLDDTTHPLGR